MSSLLYPAIHLSMFIAIVVYFSRASFVSFIKTRSYTLRDEVARTAKDLSTAKARHAEFTAKLAQMSAEVAALREQATQDAVAMKTRLKQEGSQLAAGVVADARASSQAMMADLRGTLRAELAVQVLERAEKNVREKLTGADRVRIRQEFSRQVGGASS